MGTTHDVVNKSAIRTICVDNYAAQRVYTISRLFKKLLKSDIYIEEVDKFCLKRRVVKSMDYMPYHHLYSI